LVQIIEGQLFSYKNFELKVEQTIDLSDLCFYHKVRLLYGNIKGCMALNRSTGVMLKLSMEAL